MAKTLATFRLEETDWKEFHDWARSQGSTATMELSRFVLGKLGKLDVPTPLDSNQLDTKLDALIDSKLEARLKDIQILDDSNIDDRIATLIDSKLDKRIDEKLSIVELAIADLQSSKSNEEASADLDPVKEKDDPISNCSPIFTDPDPDPSLDDELGELIEQKLQGKQGFITTSNLWKLLGLQGNKPEQEKAEVILIDRGCTKQKGSSTDGTRTGWIIP